MGIDLIGKLYEILDKEFIEEFIKLININCRSIRKPKYSNEYYLYYIILVLTDLKSWKSLKLLLPEKHINHYKTIQDKHLEWSKGKLYEKAYKSINAKYNTSKLKGSANLTLFIDSTNVYNKGGQEKIGYGQNPKKQESRISALCDKNKNIYSLTLVTPRQKTETKRTFHNDSRTIEQSLDNLSETPIKYNALNLVGDKGYALKPIPKAELKSKRNVNLIYPHRRNQKIKTPAEHKVLLKDRYVIENVFAKLKVYGRICVRMDKLESTFMGFAYLAAMLIFKK